MRTCLNAESRSEKRRSALRALRGRGRLPAVLYGRNAGHMMIHVPAGEIRRQLQSGRTELIDLQVEGQTYPVLIKEIQRDRVTGELLHVDFQQVAMDEPVRMKVPVELVGAAPGAKEGGLLQVEATHVEVEGLPDKIPPVIHADIGHLQIGDKLTAGDLTIPEGVELLSERDEVLVTVLAARGAGAGEDAEESGAAAEAE